MLPCQGTKINGQVLHATIPYIRAAIPIIIVFRALGIVTDNEVLSRICYDFKDKQMMELLRPSLEEAFEIQSQEVALNYIGTRGSTVGATRDKRIQYAREILQKEMLPHIGIQEGCEFNKAYFFGYIIHRLLSTYLGRREFDDRDHFANKRMDLAGPLLGTLFRQKFAQLLKETRLQVMKRLDAGRDFTLGHVINRTTMTKGLQYALSTGNWTANRKGPVSKTGVAQVLQRLTFASTLSHLRRLNSPVGREGKDAKPRQLHNTHWGMICPAETPEGQACGLVKNLALMAYIR